MEVWKTIEDFVNYEISNLGKVRNVKSGKDMKPSFKYSKLQQITQNKTYLKVNLRRNGKHHSKSMHRLVANAFIPNPLEMLQVNHINGNKMDNRVENLEWRTARGNVLHSFEYGLNKNIGESHVMSVLLEVEVLEIYIKSNYSKETHKSISEFYGVTRSHVSAIKNKRKWKRLLMGKSDDEIITLLKDRLYEEKEKR